MLLRVCISPRHSTSENGATVLSKRQETLTKAAFLYCLDSRFVFEGTLALVYVKNKVNHLSTVARKELLPSVE